MDSKKQLTISIVAVMTLVLMIVGVSYAAFTFTGMGQRANTITTGVISMSFTESSNIISIDKALPTTDTTGKTRLKDGEYFDFTLSSTIKGSTNVNWEIAAEDITSSTAKKIDGKHIKLYLTKLNTDGTEEEVMLPKVYSTNSANNYTGRPAGMMSLAKGTTGDSFSTKYRLRMYVDETYNPQGDGGDLNFSVKINAYGKVTTEAMPTGGTLRAYMLPSDTKMPSVDFHTTEYKEKITSIVTKNDNIVPSTALASYDVSEEQNKSVMAYVEDDGTGAETYKLTIGGKDGIIANESMRNYFYGFTNVKSMDLSNLDTSFTTTMDSMFINCSSLKELNISNFNTSNVTNMKNMFIMCSGLTSLDLTNFDTSKVTNMATMFANCRGLSSINLSSFNTSNVTDMNNMFNGCDGLISLDLSGFNTSNVTNMYGMFVIDSQNFVDLNLSGFDFSHVISAGLGLVRCPDLKLDMTGANFKNLSNSLVSSVLSGITASEINLSDADFTNTDMNRIFQSGNTKKVNLSGANFTNATMKNMFGGNNGITSIDFTNTITTGVTDMSSMFAGCSRLTSLNLSSFDTSSVTDMSAMFAATSNLASITVGKKWIVGSSTNVRDMFGGSGTDHVTAI